MGTCEECGDQSNLPFTICKKDPHMPLTDLRTEALYWARMHMAAKDIGLDQGELSLICQGPDRMFRMVLITESSWLATDLFGPSAARWLRTTRWRGAPIPEVLSKGRLQDLIDFHSYLVGVSRLSEDARKALADLIRTAIRRHEDE